MKSAILSLLLLLQLYNFRLIQSSEISSDEHNYLKGFKKSYGTSHFDAFNSAHGEKGDKMYKTNHYHRNGLKGSFEKGYDQGQFGNDYGENKFSLDAKHSSAGGKKGAEYGEHERYKNNKKQAGYGELYNLEALNKNNAFYNKANKMGKSNKYGNAHTYFVNNQKGRKSGGNSRSNQQSHGYKIR
ncbi:protein of unknown function (DUF4779) [Popillia japonica]|uniref:Uncharacterized protein n=1 Tax=Popillia japonica TaxID=7064 RepID=A0AAW1IAL2_POPJA